MLYKTQVRELKEEVDEKTKACVDLENRLKALELEKYGVFFIVILQQIFSFVLINMVSLLLRNTFLHPSCYLYFYLSGVCHFQLQKIM